MERKQLKEEVVAVLSDKFWAAKLLISETLITASYLPRVTAGDQTSTTSA